MNEVRWVTCFICGGSGRVATRVPGETMVCAHCKGTGECLEPAPKEGV